MTATVKVDHFQELSKQEHVGAHYKNLPIFALPELHGFVVDKALAHVPENARVLDLASGSGAMTLRLLDNGFNVESTDLVDEGFRLHGQVPFYKADFNTNFHTAMKGPYDAVTALEIIEHLENPRHFLRECMALLKPGGLLFLSTPNIDTPRSVLRFIRKGHFRQFGEEDYRTSGHITPVSQWQLEKMVQEGGWIVKEMTSCGAPYGKGLRHISAKVVNMMMAGNPRLRGAILVAVLQKPL